MHIRPIIKPVADLALVSYDDTIGTALKVIEDSGYLSLPVVDGEKFVGVLSRKYIYEMYFNENGGDKEAFMKRRVAEFMKTKIEPIKENILIEDAAALFLEKQLKFIPICDEHDRFEGIVTPSAILERYRKIYGSKNPRLVIYTFDFKGKLAKILEVIAKHHGSVKNIVQMDTEVMGLQEISLRVDCKDIDKVVKGLRGAGFEVREYAN